MLLWSAALAAGIPNELFWELTAPEVEAVLERRAEEERRVRLLFGLVAAQINNSSPHRRRAVRPQDFFRERPKPEDFMDLEEAKTFMDGWAASQNAGHVQ